MRRLYWLITALMLAVGSTADTKSPWIEVEGGAWVPDMATMSIVRAGLEGYVRSEAKRQKRDILPWAEYSFQFQGREAKGQRYIFVNAFCVALGQRDLHSQFVEVNDGGSCFFGVTYDPKSRRFGDLRVNSVR